MQIKQKKKIGNGEVLLTVVMEPVRDAHGAPETLRL